MIGGYMATKQKPILELDESNESIESTSDFVKSRRRTSLEEFALTQNIRPEIQAGFKAWLKGDNFHFDEEWDTLFESYTNRQLKGGN